MATSKDGLSLVRKVLVQMYSIYEGVVVVDDVEIMLHRSRKNGERLLLRDSIQFAIG